VRSEPQDYEFHPYSELFPLLHGKEFADLVADVKANGLREPVWLYDGQILDGRNRYLACEHAGLTAKTRAFKGNDAEALAFVISANVHRRHLTESQRAMAAAKIATLGVGANQHREGTARAAPSQSEAAATFDVSPDSVQRARKVVEKGSKALKEAVESGEVPVKRAAAVVNLPKPQQLKAATEKPVAVTPAPDFDFDGYEPEDDEDYRRSIDNVMASDDKLSALREELKQAHREIAALKASRDHYQSQAGEAVRLVKSRDREIDKLRRELAKRGAA